MKVKLFYLIHVYWIRLIIIIAFHRIKAIGTYEGHINGFKTIFLLFMFYRWFNEENFESIKRLCVYVCLYVCVSMYMYVCVCACVWLCMYLSLCEILFMHTLSYYKRTTLEISSQIFVCLIPCVIFQRNSCSTMCFCIFC